MFHLILIHVCVDRAVQIGKHFCVSLAYSTKSNINFKIHFANLGLFVDLMYIFYKYCIDQYEKASSAQIILRHMETAFTNITC